MSTSLSLHTQQFLQISIDYSLLKQNFKTLDLFIKNFSIFQKKFIELQKSQKNLQTNYNQFKLITENQFNSLNEVLDSRSQITKGKSNASNQQLNDIKKTIKQLKVFVTQSTRQQSQLSQIKQKQSQQKHTHVIKQLQKHTQQQKQTQKQLNQLKSSISDLFLQSATKKQTYQLSQDISNLMKQLNKNQSKLSQIQHTLKQTKVQQFKQTIQIIQKQTKQTLNEMKIKFNTKANLSDLLKLQEMLLNVINKGYQNNIKTLANKEETKKALIFLEKRFNSLMVTMLGEEEGERQAILTTKQLKCISCTKDLGQLQGKLDKYKAWSVFPVKQSVHKQKYSGFGAGFQSIVQSSIVKKGGDVTIDEKGRMISPFNLTGTVHGNAPSQQLIMNKTARSQSKLQQISSSNSHHKNPIVYSPNKISLKYQTNFMYQFGKVNGQNQMNLIQEYYSSEKGLESFMILNGKSYY